MRKVLAGFAILIFISLKSSCQKISISLKEIQPLNLLSGNKRIVDTSGNFINDSYQMNQKFWKIYFSKAIFDKSSKLLMLYGAAALNINKVDSFKISNFDVYLGVLTNDTLANIKHLNEADFIQNNKGNFQLEMNLKRHNVVIFSSSGRLPRIYDFSSILQ